MAALEQRLQMGKRKRGLKEVRCLIAAEAERTKALEKLITVEADKSQQHVKKLYTLQKEMDALTPR